MKARILDAAALELNARGIKFTMNALASRLGISKKTLYTYFPSKDAVIAGVVGAVLDDIDIQRKAILAKDLSLADRLAAILTVKPKRFGEMNESVVSDIRCFYPNEWTKMQEFHQQQLTIIMALLEQGKITGEIRAVNCHVAATMLVGSISLLLEREFLTKQNLTISGALQCFTDLFLNGVLNKQTSQNGGAA